MSDGMLDGGYYEQRIAALEDENARLTAQMEFQLNLVDKVQDERDALATRCRELGQVLAEIRDNECYGANAQQYAKIALDAAIKGAEPTPK